MLEALKTFITSKRAVAMAVSVLSGLLGKYGYEVTDNLQGDAVELIFNGVSALAGLYAIGRHVKEKKK